MPHPVDQRLLNDGARAMALTEPKTLKEMEEQLRIIYDGALALQSMDNLGSPEANQQAWDDMLELQRRAEALSKKIEELKQRDTKNHDVRLDYVGMNSHPRFTCYSEGCNGATLVRQPFMDFQGWEKETEEFSAKHPCSKIKNEGHRG